MGLIPPPLFEQCSKKLRIWWRLAPLSIWVLQSFQHFQYFLKFWCFLYYLAFSEFWVFSILGCLYCFQYLSISCRFLVFPVRFDASSLCTVCGVVCVVFVLFVAWCGDLMGGQPSHQTSQLDFIATFSLWLLFHHPYFHIFICISISRTFSCPDNFQDLPGNLQDPPYNHQDPPDKLSEITTRIL